MGALRILAATLLIGLFAAPAAHGQEWLVTYAARACPSYSDVTANLARNDIQESLQDLGADTLYTSGEPISARTEQQGQPNCRPLTNWHFHLGTGYQSLAVSGTWGSLSKVTGDYDTSIVTQASTPLLDRTGRPTGISLPGAVTVPLTADQLQRAQASNSLWLQGGDIDDPVLDKPYPNQYGFAALRCSIDNLNGDNVEWIGFPSGVTHVLCYAYYVEPPPTSGTIIVKKVVDDAQATASQAFSFEGNITYSPDHRFTLNAANGQPGSETFYRAASPTQPWTFTEQLPAGWTLASLACTSTTGASTTTTSVATAATSVTLGASDTVTCTYTNRQTPPQAGLQLSKRTLGGVGRFGFGIAGPDRGRQSITTTTPGVPVAGAPLKGTAGKYTITETSPARSADGHWRPVKAVCGGRAFDPVRPVTLTLSGGAGVACEFTNEFVPAGSLTVHKVTTGGVATAHFQISSPAGNTQYDQAATPNRPLVPIAARGDDTTHLPLGIYDIREFGRQVTARGTWSLVSVLCDGHPVAAAQGRVQIRLTRSTPHRDCTFVNRFAARPPRPAPTPTPTPTPTPNPVPTVSPTPVPTPVDPDDFAPADGPTANLSVTKTVSPHSTASGKTVQYTITVINHGPDAATDVSATEVSPPSSRHLNLHTTRGTCVGTRPARCDLGTLQSGQRAVITVDTVAGDPGRTINQVAVVSSTDDSDLSDNFARATLIVERPTAPRFTG